MKKVQITLQKAHTKGKKIYGPPIPSDWSMRIQSYQKATKKFGGQKTLFSVFLVPYF